MIQRTRKGRAISAPVIDFSEAKRRKRRVRQNPEPRAQSLIEKLQRLAELNPQAMTVLEQLADRLLDRFSDEPPSERNA